jgi:hypothetical protein
MLAFLDIRDTVCNINYWPLPIRYNRYPWVDPWQYQYFDSCLRGNLPFRAMKQRMMATNQN